MFPRTSVRLVMRKSHRPFFRRTHHRHDRAPPKGRGNSYSYGRMTGTRMILDRQRCLNLSRAIRKNGHVRHSLRRRSKGWVRLVWGGDIGDLSCLLYIQCASHSSFRQTTGRSSEMTILVGVQYPPYSDARCRWTTPSGRRRGFAKRRRQDQVENPLRWSRPGSETGGPRMGRRSGTGTGGNMVRLRHGRPARSRDSS